MSVPVSKMPGKLPYKSEYLLAVKPLLFQIICRPITITGGSKRRLRMSRAWARCLAPMRMICAKLPHPRFKCGDPSRTFRPPFSLYMAASAPELPFLGRLFGLVEQGPQKQPAPNSPCFRIHMRAIWLHNDMPQVHRPFVIPIVRSVRQRDPHANTGAQVDIEGVAGLGGFKIITRPR